MSDESLVTVARCDTRGAARLVKAQLEDAGVPCMLSNEEQAGLPMMFDETGGDVEVKVPSDRAEEARAVLDRDERRPG